MNDIASIILPIVAAIIVSVLANAGALLLWRSQRGKNKAEAADVLTGTALRIVENMEARMREMEEQVAEQEVEIVSQGKEIKVLKLRVQVLENENHDLLRGAERVIGQIVSLGQEPVWRPRAQKPT